MKERFKQSINAIGYSWPYDHSYLTDGQCYISINITRVRSTIRLKQLHINPNFRIFTLASVTVRHMLPHANLNVSLKIMRQEQGNCIVSNNKILRSLRLDTLIYKLLFEGEVNSDFPNRLDDQNENNFFSFGIVSYVNLRDSGSLTRNIIMEVLSFRNKYMIDRQCEIGQGSEQYPTVVCYVGLSSQYQSCHPHEC